MPTAHPQMLAGTKLVTTNCYKTLKGESKGYLTGIMFLSPANESSKSTCSHSTPECESTCIISTGRLQYHMAREARLRRTELFHSNPDEFLECLDAELAALQRRAKKLDMTPAFRPNGTSDLAWETYAPHLMEKYNFNWYDYTKNPTRMKRYLHGKLPPNYHLLFSLSEGKANRRHAQDFLEQKGNVAVVFHPYIPERWRPTKWDTDYPVYEGDIDDLRWKDNPGSIVGLKAKGKKARDIARDQGFVTLMKGVTRA